MTKNIRLKFNSLSKNFHNGRINKTHKNTS